MDKHAHAPPIGVEDLKPQPSQALQDTWSDCKIVTDECDSASTTGQPLESSPTLLGTPLADVLGGDDVIDLITSDMRINRLPEYSRLTSSSNNTQSQAR